MDTAVHVKVKQNVAAYVRCKCRVYVFSASSYRWRGSGRLIWSRPQWKSVKIWPAVSFHQLCVDLVIYLVILSHHLHYQQCLNICIYKKTAWKDWKGESPKFTCNEQLSESYKLWFFVSRISKTGMIDFSFSFMTSSYKYSCRMAWILRIKSFS